MFSSNNPYWSVFEAKNLLYPGIFTVCCVNSGG